MNSKAIYTTPVNRIKQKVLFNDGLSRLTHICANWAEYVQELAEWGITTNNTLAGVNLNNLSEWDIQYLDIFIKNQNGYDEEV